MPAGKARWGQGDGGGRGGGDRQGLLGAEARWRQEKSVSGGGEVASGVAGRTALARRGMGDTAERRR